MNVRVHRRLPSYIGRHILDVVIGRNYNAAIRLDDADVTDVHLLVHGRVGKGEYGHLFYAGVGKNVDPRC
jgi:hypothetical protein